MSFGVVQSLQDINNLDYSARGLLAETICHTAEGMQIRRRAGPTQQPHRPNHVPSPGLLPERPFSLFLSLTNHTPTLCCLRLPSSLSSHPLDKTESEKPQTLSTHLLCGRLHAVETSDALHGPRHAAFAKAKMARQRRHIFNAIPP